MKKSFYVLMAALSLTALHCGKNEQKTESKTENFSYQFKESINGAYCDTGKREFTSKDAYCKGLTDRKANNDCALEQRKRRYEAECGGTFVETNMGEKAKSPVVPAPPVSTPVEDPAELVIEGEIIGHPTPTVVTDEGLTYSVYGLQFNVTKISDPRIEQSVDSVVPGPKTGDALVRFKFPSSQVQLIGRSMGDCKEISGVLVAMRKNNQPILQLEAQETVTSGEDAHCPGVFVQTSISGLTLVFDGAHTLNSSRNYSRLTLKLKPDPKL